MMRSHTCGELTKKQVGEEVTLCGWVQSRRDHGGVIFIDLRDRYGLTQVVFDPSHNEEAHRTAEHLGREWVLRVVGKVRDRKEGMINEKLKTGEVEVITDHLDILNKSDVPPIEIEDNVDVTDETRLKYRYIDLRRPVMQKRLMTRHKTAAATREYLNKQNFIEIETPLLIKATPEGARDYVVPSRVNPGKFYALPQSPQLYKQILMVSGFDRYYQLPRCLRDEDLRADRQPEHTQIDLEMSFVQEEDVFKVIEGLINTVFKGVLNKDIPKEFPRIKYADAMHKYGSDKPDLRFGLELVDVSEIGSRSDFGVFKSVVDKGGVVKALRVEKGASFTRKDIEDLEAVAKTHHAKGLAWVKVAANNTLEGVPAKFFNADLSKELIDACSATDGDLLLFVADSFPLAPNAMGQVRLALGKKLKLIPEDSWSFCWIVDFPLFEWNETENRLDAMHHPFCMPKEQDIPLLESNPKDIVATQYDLVINGVEMGSGSIRVHKPEIQKKILDIIGIDEKEAEEKFGFLLESYKFGGPPHGGIALGLDRLVTVMIGLTDIREVISFPKNKQAQCPMDSSPADVSSAQMRELNIKLDIAKK